MVSTVSASMMTFDDSFGDAAFHVTNSRGSKSGAIDIMSKTGSLSGGNLNTDGFSLRLNWDVDPSLSWTYTTTVSGPQTIQVTTAILEDVYNRIFVSAGYTITGARRGKGASIKDVTVKAYAPLPIAAKNYIPEGDVTVKGTKAPVKGTLTRGNDNTNSGGLGALVPFAPRKFKDMGVEIKFDAILNPGDTLSLNGTMTVEQVGLVPEPTTLGVIGAALIAFGAFRRRSA